MKSLAAVVAAGLALAASGTAANAQISDDLVKIGVLTDMSSLYSDSGGKGSQIAAEMAVEDFGGSVLGQKIQVMGADHQNKPDIGANIARSWYDNDGVDVISDVPNSAVALAVSADHPRQEQDLPDLGRRFVGPDRPACSPNSVHWTYDTYALAHGTAAPWSSRAATAGSSSPPTTPSAMRSSAIPAPRSRKGGKVLGDGPRPAEYHRLLVLPAAGPGVQGQGRGSGQCRRRHEDTRSSRPMSSASPRRAEAGRAACGNIDDIHALGLATAQGLIFTDRFYWDLNDETRAFAKRFMAKDGLMPSTYRPASIPRSCIT